MAGSDRVARIRRWLPRGRTLPEDGWRRRHHGVLILLWIHTLVIPAFALARGYSLAHSLAEGAIVPLGAVIATSTRVSRRARTITASLALLSSSAVLVHLSGGVIEMHFHFFVMVAVVALYQDWLPFLAASGYVLIHHGVLGAIDARSVYNHPAAIASPWKWAGIHALFIAGISAACLVNWRLNETLLAQRRRAEQRLRENTRVVETLNDVGKTLAAELDLHGVMQRVTDAGTELTAAAFGAFFHNVEDGNGGGYMLYTLSGVPRSAFESFPMPRRTALFGPTFIGEEIVRLDDVTQDPRFGLNPPYRGFPPGHLPVRSYLAVPVRSRGGSVFGGLFFGHPEPGRFTELDERIVGGIAAHAAIAIDNAGLYESERAARAASESAQRRLSLLSEASRALASSLELEAVLQDLTGIVVPAAADSCAVYLLDDDGALRVAAVRAASSIHGLAADRDPAAGDLSNEAHPVVRAIRSRRSLLIESVTEELLEQAIADPEHREAARQLGTVSVIVVPLIGRQHTFGALLLNTVTSSGRRLGADDLALAEELAHRTAVAVENARLFAAQRSAAETLQHSLLPERLPEIPGIDTAVRYIPGGPGVEIGGDWYDVIELPDGMLGLVMGDVVGRGVAAASLMGQLRNALRAYALDGAAPAEVATRLNHMLNDIGPEDRMATLVYGVFDPDTGTLRLTNAGHPPPLIAGVDGSIELLEQDLGVPLGAVARARYTETITSLAPGATLLLYTDGLIEDRHTPLDDGLARLRSAVASAPADLSRLCDHILARTLDGREAKDDVAVLAMRSLPLGDRLRLRLPARPTVLRSVRSTVRRWLSATGATDEEAYDVLVAVGEACANAIQHAGRGVSDFELEATWDGEIHIRVRDRGRWRQPRVDTGGRGLMIIRELMENVEVRSDHQGTEVRMSKRILPAPDRRSQV